MRFGMGGFQGVTLSISSFRTRLGFHTGVSHFCPVVPLPRPGGDLRDVYAFQGSGPGG